MKILVVCSGGLDSVTLAYKAAREQTFADLITFNYGQRHVREIDCAASTARALKTRHDVIDISDMGARTRNNFRPTPPYQRTDDFFLAPVNHLPKQIVIPIRPLRFRPKIRSACVAGRSAQKMKNYLIDFVTA